MTDRALSSVLTGLHQARSRGLFWGSSRNPGTRSKSTLLGISKRGDSYLRTLLVHGARAVVRYAEGKTDPSSDWLKGLLTRRNTNVAVIAQANKNARIAWALLAHNRRFRSGYTPAVAGA